MKCFSKEKLDLELENLLDLNEESYDSYVDLTIEEVSKFPMIIANYRFNNFRMEVPQNVSDNCRFIVIFENEKEEKKHLYQLTLVIVKIKIQYQHSLKRLITFRILMNTKRI